MASKNPQDMMAAVSTSMQERTGKTLEEWVAAVLTSGIDPVDQKAVRNWFKDVHHVPQNSQWAIADTAATTAGWQQPSNESDTDNQYAGEKAVLRPIFNKLRQLAEACGQDVLMEGRAGYTPLDAQTPVYGRGGQLQNQGHAGPALQNCARLSAFGRRQSPRAVHPPRHLDQRGTNQPGNLEINQGRL